MVQPEDAAERRKASGVPGTCSGTAEDIAVQRMPRGMPSRLGETLRNVTEWRWKSQQPGDAVRRQAEDGTIVGGSAEDRSGGGRRVTRRKMHRKAEDASGAEAESETERQISMRFSSRNLLSSQGDIVSAIKANTFNLTYPTRTDAILPFHSHD